MGRKNKLNQKVGEVEVEYFVFPKEIKEIIEKQFLSYRGTGRKSVLLKVKEQGKDPFKILLKMYYLLNVEGYSYRDISEWFKKEVGLDVSKSAVADFIKKLKQLGIHDQLVSMACEKVRRKLRYYYVDKDGRIKSDIDYVQEYINMRSLKLSKNVLLNYLKAQAEVCKMTGKLPHQWAKEELAKVLKVKYEYFRDLVFKKAEDGHSKFSKLTESDLENIARNNVFHFVVGVRSILRYIGRNDLLESVLKTDVWKRQVSHIERLREYLTFEEVMKILRSNYFTEREKIVIKLHLTLGCREGWNSKGGLWNLTWDTVWLDENESPYGYTAVDIFESKTKGGVWWRGIYLKLFFDDLPEQLKKYRPANYKGVRVVESLGFSKKSLKQLYKKIERFIGRRFTAHFMRHSHATLLVKAGVPMQLVAGKPESAFFGVGWEDLSTLFKYYVSLGAWSLKEYQKELQKVKSALKL